MDNSSHYIIQGGDAGAARLHVLSKAMWPGTLSLLEKGGLGPGLAVLDLGCGSGDVTVQIARQVGPTGRVVGVDMDASVLAHAQASSQSAGLDVEWRAAMVDQLEYEGEFDIVYARFLLSHLPDPVDALRRMKRALRPHGRILVEDVDITQHVCWPPNQGMKRYIELYTATARSKGVDPQIGPQLPALLLDAGLVDVDVQIVMPAFLRGEEKTIARLTLQNISQAAIESGLADRTEIEQMIADLAAHEADPRSIQSTAQVFQAVGYVLMDEGS